MNKLFLLIVIIAVIGCQQSHASKPQGVTVLSSQQPVIIEQPTTVQLESIDSCLPALYPDTWLDTVMAHPKIARFTWDDGCVLATIDSLKARIISGQCSRCLEVLNAVATVADGYVGEKLDDVAGKLYYNAFEPFIEFLANPHYNSDDLFGNLAHSFYYEIGAENAQSAEVRRAAIIADIHQKMQNRPEPQRQILRNLEKKVREIKYDE